ncbi:pyruvate dehydrogenase complex dihydrolipoamide acetyltransferase [Candidatus Viadribacter manganicus]|uniref:Acetyltransferase component of pyruvate dehydrogenase complex n=1 Tax=Candidatus Viadribacter manganicus TaxID=1759059 RepID=A0A1B1AD76_9PROT|nr:pyruvate dehydrogenase complex dihydrolipoamide acetyltransferase [Candidatus Viadribacter manganicus]ANP44516.1 branched-chain alpha-keto acid dehydrogenase subunit E2 [Candidatus Viadribacter manganicus]
MSIPITMPALSPTMEEGNLSKWHVKAGDKIEPGQVIAEIETDKATMEVEAVDEGVIAEILVPEGSQGVKVNTPIAVLSGEGQAAKPAAAKSSAPTSTEAKQAPPEPTSKRAAPAPQTVASKPAERILASPLARRLAEQGGIDLSGLQGSGPNGRIVRADVEAARKAPPAATQTQASQQSREVTKPAPQQAPPATLESYGIRSNSYDLVPLDLMRKTIAKRMTSSFRDVPHFPLTIDLEIDALLKARGEINKRFADNGVKISVNDMCIKAAALALKLVPEANASYTPDGIAMHHHADVAVAVAIPHGLITPIIWAAETKGLAQISAEMADLALRARERKLKPEEFQGGTFSISNMGMLGIKSFASIINEPHGMIMSIGAGEKRPIVKNDALAIATMMTVTVTCDHRVVDGALGAAFLKAFKSFLEDPMAMLL